MDCLLAFICVMYPKATPIDALVPPAFPMCANVVATRAHQLKAPEKQYTLLKMFGFTYICLGFRAFASILQAI